MAFTRSGHTVDVVEKHPSLKTLGAGVLIQPQGVAALDEPGVGSAFEAISMPIARLNGQCERGWTAPLGQWKDELLALWAESRPVVERIVSHDQIAFASYHHARPIRLAAGCASPAMPSTP